MARKQTKRNTKRKLAKPGMAGKGNGTHWVDTDVGIRLRNQRKAQSISQAKLGADVGISFQQIQKYEKGANRITISMLWELSHALHIPMARLLPPASRPELNDNYQQATEAGMVPASL